MRYARIFNDLHIYGPLQIMTEPELFILVVQSPYPVIFLGDIFDLKNCRKSEVGACKDSILKFKSIEHVTYVNGNHELGYAGNPENYIMANTFFSHSHLLSNRAKYSSWNLRDMEAGAGFFKRSLITPTIDLARHLYAVRPNDELLGNLDTITKQNEQIDTVYLAHSHPKTNIVFKVNQATCTMLQRGYRDVQY